MIKAIFKYPSVNSKDVPLFDLCRNGKRVRAERYDEPGDESPTESSINDPTVRHRSRAAFLLTADIGGDWSWKPRHNAQFGMPAYPGAMRGAAELYRQEAFYGS